MSPRAMLLTLAAVLVAAGLFLGLRTISTGGTDCGSAFSPSSGEAKMDDTIDGAFGGEADALESCDSAIGDAKPFAYGGIGLGAVALIAAFVASPQGAAQTDGPKPSLWR